MASTIDDRGHTQFQRNFSAPQENGKGRGEGARPPEDRSDLVSGEAFGVETVSCYQAQDEIPLAASYHSLGYPKEPVFPQGGAQMRRDDPAIRFFLSRHHDQAVVIEQDAEMILRYQLPGPRPDIHPVLRFPVGIALGPLDKFGEAIDVSFVSVVPVADLDTIRNPYPTGREVCAARVI